MPIKVTCSNCGGVLHAPDDAAGKRGRCPTCGTVLTIAPDSPRVPSQAVIPPPAHSGPLEAASRPIPQPPPARPIPVPAPPVTYGLAESTGVPSPSRPLADEPPPSARPNAFPRTSMQSPPPPTRKAVAPAKPTDPFARQGNPADAAELAARRWAKTRRGLGWVQAGVFFLFLAAAALPALKIAGEFGVKLPEKSPGYAKVDGLGTTDEIKVAAAAVPALLGLFFVVVGRLGAGNAPAESFGRGAAKVASWGSLLAFLSLVAAGVVTGIAMTSGGGYVPSFGTTVPGPNRSEGPNIQKQVDAVIRPLFLAPDDPTGQVQRVGLLAFVAFALVAEVWFLNALGRFAAALQGATAAGRVTCVLALAGLLVLLLLVGPLVYDLFGETVWAEQVKPKWDGLGVKTQGLIGNGLLIGGALIAATVYCRMLGGVKRAIRDVYDMPAA